MEVSELIELLRQFENAGGTKPAKSSVRSAKKTKRKASAYSQKYAKAFKKVQGKYKLKSGKWAKDGFKRAQKAAHKMAKRMR